MIPLNIVMAVVLITADVSEDYADFTDCQYVSTTQDIRSIAVWLELMDEDQASNFFNDLDHGNWRFSYDLKIIRSLYRLLEDAPPLEDLKRFSQSVKYLSNMHGFNSNFIRYLDEKRNLYAETDPYVLYLDDVINEVRKNGEFWDVVMYAKLESQNVVSKRIHLKTIKQRIGDKNYYNGNFPPIVPFSYLAEIH